LRKEIPAPNQLVVNDAHLPDGSRVLSADSTYTLASRAQTLFLVMPPSVEAVYQETSFLFLCESQQVLIC